MNQCSPTYRNQSIDFQSRPVDWFLYDGEHWSIGTRTFFKIGFFSKNFVVFVQSVVSHKTTFQKHFGPKISNRTDCSTKFLKYSFFYSLGFETLTILNALLEITDKFILEILQIIEAKTSQSTKAIFSNIRLNSI